jgi:dTDP-4-amino-4,6-dideoxygalactose transaminase
LSSQIPLVKIDVSDSLHLVQKVLLSGNLAMGEMVREFESAIANTIGVKHAIAVNNGTSALSIVGEALEIGPGDEVITTPFSFIATVNSMIRLGAKVIFVDIDEYFNMDVEKIEAKITARTKAIVPVSLFGQTANMNQVMAIASRYGLRVVEDASQSLMAKHQGWFSGTFDIGTFSFYATKNLCTGEGGMITTNDDDLAQRVRLIRNQGMQQRYEYVISGSNYRMTDLQAAVGIPQIEKMPRVIQIRNHNAKFLTQELSKLKEISVPKVMVGNESVWHQYTIQMKPEFANYRNQLSEILSQKGVGNGKYYPNVLYDFDFVRRKSNLVDKRERLGHFPIAEYAARSCLSLPIHQYLSETDLIQISKAVAEAIREIERSSA